MSIINLEDDLFEMDKYEALTIDRFGRIRPVGVINLDRPPMESGSLLIQRQDVGVAHLVTLFGSLDRNTAQAFEDLVDWMGDDPSRSIHLDLSALRVIDVHGLAVIDGVTDQRSDLVSPVHVLIESQAVNQLRRLVSDIGLPAARRAA